MSMLSSHIFLLILFVSIMCRISDCSDLMNNISTDASMYASINQNKVDISEIFPEKSLDSKVPGWSCHCWSSINENEVVLKYLYSW